MPRKEAKEGCQGRKEGRKEQKEEGRKEDRDRLADVRSFLPL
jgi:hypothetical protein